ncbi:MAG: glycosyltransferase [Verrucomicrobiota bacterium]
MKQITLVTPVYNDSKRLSVFGPKLAKAVAEANLPIQWIVSDDGSDSNEKRLVEKKVEELLKIYPQIRFLPLAERTYKGGAVYEAWDQSNDSDWLGFVDADGAIDAQTIINLFKEALASSSPSAWIAVRQNSPSTPVDRGIARKQSFRIFNSLVRRLLGIRFKDTQCGAKVLAGPVYREISNRLEERGFAFDLELLVALESNHYEIREVPIPWREIAGSKVHPLRDAWPMLRSVLRIRRRLKAGHYRKDRSTD